MTEKSSARNRGDGLQKGDVHLWIFPSVKRLLRKDRGFYNFFWDKAETVFHELAAKDGFGNEDYTLNNRRKKKRVYVNWVGKTPDSPVVHLVAYTKKDLKGMKAEVAEKVRAYIESVWKRENSYRDN